MPDCETCDGTGKVQDGHYADPNTRTLPCPDCSEPDPDERFERERLLK